MQNLIFDTANVNSLTIGATSGPALLLTKGGQIQTTSTVINSQTINAPLVLEGNYTFTSGASTNSATLTFGGGITPAATSGGTTLTLNGSNTGANTISGALANNPGAPGGLLALNVAGPGLWMLTGANSYSGGTTISGGTLNINADGALGATTANPNITFNGNGTLQFATGYSGTTLSSSRSISIVAGQSGTLDTNGNNITYAGLLTSSGTFGKAGAGILEMDGAPTLNANSGLSVTGGTLRLKYGSAPTIGGTVSGSVSNGATLELASSVSQLSQMVNIANAGTLLDSSSINQNVGVVTSTGNTIVNAGGSLTAYEIRQNSLTITGNAKVTLLPSGSGSTTAPAAPNNINFSSDVAALSIGGMTSAWTGTLDIGNNGLVIQYGAGSDPFTTITNMVRSGYANGNWTGTGITSSLARAAALLGSPTPALNIGIIDFVPNTGTFGSSIVFEGQTISTSAVLLRLTYMDDLVLSGDMAQANATSDALFFAANYGSGTIWHVGDITHDGVIDTNDALLFAANYVVGLPSLDGTTGNAAALGNNAAAVPEPASLLLVMLGAVGLGARWWRN